MMCATSLRFGVLLAPVVRFYQILLFPIVKPTAMVLDRWLGREAISYFKERGVREFIKLHMASFNAKGISFILSLYAPVRVSGEGFFLYTGKGVTRACSAICASNDISQRRRNVRRVNRFFCL